jgi:hypothetical protein
VTTLFGEPSKEEFPEPRIEDVALTTGKAAASIASIVPGGIGTLGVFGASLLGMLTAPVDQRRAEWWEDIARRLRDTEGKVAGFSFENLGQNPQFVSATLQATQAALRTHQKEKLDALRNAILNVALGKQPDSSRQQQFLGLVERFSEDHLVVLRFLDDPASHFRRLRIAGPQINHVGGKLMVNSLVTMGLPYLQKQSREDQSSTAFQYLEMILTEIEALHLARFERHQQTWAVPSFAIQPGGGPVGKMTTHLGEDFLAFIAEPVTGA